MKSTFLHSGKQRKLPELFQNLPYSCDVTISIIINVDKDIIQIYNDEDVKLPSKNLIDKSLEACRYIC